MSKRSLFRYSCALAICISLSPIQLGLLRSDAARPPEASLVKTILFGGTIVDSMGKPVAGTMQLLQVVAGKNVVVATLPIDPVNGSVNGKVPVDLSQTVLAVEVKILNPAGGAILNQEFSGQTVGITGMVLWIDELRFSLTLDATTHAIKAAMIRPSFFFP